MKHLFDELRLTVYCWWKKYDHFHVWKPRYIIQRKNEYLPGFFDVGHPAFSLGAARIQADRYRRKNAEVRIIRLTATIVE